MKVPAFIRPNLVLAAFLSVTPSARAQTYTYDAMNGTWGTASNWSPTGIPNSSTATAVIPSGANTVGLGGNTYTVNHLETTGPFGVEVSAGTLILAGANPLINGSFLTNGSFTIGSNLQLNQTTTFEGPGGGVQVGGVISGPGGLDLAAGSDATLQTALSNTYTGDTTVGNSAQLRLEAAGTAIAGNLILDGGRVDSLPNEVLPTTVVTFTANGGAYYLESNVAAQEQVAGFAGPSGTVHFFYGGLSANSGGTFTLAGTGSYDFGGQITQDAPAHDLSLLKIGTGIQELDGANTYRGGTTIEAGALISGNNTALGLGAAVVSAGTLQLGGIARTLAVGSTYTQTAEGRLSLRVNDGGSDTVHVTGTANLGHGILALDLAGLSAGAPRTTTDYTLLTSTGLDGSTFNPRLEVNNLPTGDALTLDYTNNDTDVVLAVAFDVLFPTRGLDNNQSAVLSPINRSIAANLSPNFITVDNALARIATSNPANFGHALDEFSPEKFAYFSSRTANNNASFEAQAMDDYLAGQRGGIHGTFLPGGTGIDSSGLTVNDPDYDPALAFIHSRMVAWNPGPLDGALSDVAPPLLGGVDMKDTKDMKEEGTSPCAPPLHFFVRGQVTLAQGFSQADVPHFDDNTESVVLGADYRLTPSLLVGLTAGYGHTDVTLDNNGSSATVDSYSPGFYVAYADRGWFANLTGTYLHNAYTQERVIGVLGQTASSAPEGNQGVADIDGGYEFHHGAFSYGPLAGLQYAHLSVDGYSEAGSAANLNVGGDESDSLRSRLGATLRYAFAGRRIAFTPHLDASWQHEFLDQSRGIDSQFGFGGGSFFVRTPDPSRESALVDLGLTVDFQRMVSLFAGYIVQVGQDNYFGQSIQAGLKLAF